MIITKSRKIGSYRFIGAISGLLLMIPNIYPVLAPLQLFALLPILYLGAKRETTHSVLLTAGMYMGLVYTLPQMIILRLPIPVTVILLINLTIVMIILVWFGAQLIRKSPIWGSFAFGAFLVILDYSNFTVIPIWGTAQSIVRPWSQYPSLMQFCLLTGITGIIFVLGTLQVLIINAIINPKIRRKLLAAVILIVLIFTGIDMILYYQKPVGKLKVAAIGWATNDFSEIEYPQTSKGFEALFTEPIIKAVSQGAKLVVSPEMGFYINKQNHNELFGKLQAISSKYNIFLAIGYFDIPENKNSLIFIRPDGQSLPEYNKTYLTPYEDYSKGDGQLRVLDLEGVSVGGMICQDDNFTQLSREYGRKKISFVAVPTLDWSTVKNTHLQNSIHRAIESRYAIIRATINGISAIISPKGEVLVSCDHFEDGPAVIVADVPFYKCRTFFSFAGNWTVIVSFIYLIVYVSYNFIWIRLRNRIDINNL